MPRASSSKAPKGKAKVTAKSESSSRQSEDYLFFWTTSHINGWASQWYPASFTAEVTISGAQETHEFPSAEHWMMLHKALLFSDVDIARKILSVTSTNKKALAGIKAFGRQVSNFDDAIWKKQREQIVLNGNLHKFRQNEEIKMKLLATGDKIIAEASPRDKIWGIGFGEKNAPERFDKWGLNLLGKALMETRRRLREEGDAAAQ